MTNTDRQATLTRELLVGLAGIENHQSYREFTHFQHTTPNPPQFPDALYDRPPYNVVVDGREMTWEESAEYLTAKNDQTAFVDPERGRESGLSQFLDAKTYKPGLGNYPR